MTQPIQPGDLIEECALIADNVANGTHAKMMACKPGSSKAREWAAESFGAQSIAVTIRALKQKYATALGDTLGSEKP